MKCMGFVLNKLMISNFKYITTDRPITIDLNNSNMIVLNGQNGYGKTTLFDAIELLITGKIHHIQQVLNKGEITIGDLANDKCQDIIIEGVFCDFSEKIVIRRTFDSEHNFMGTIQKDGNLITQEELYGYFRTSETLIRMGTYMSQSQSLDFLQNKYKDRKSKISSLVESPEIDRKVALIKDAEQVLLKKCADCESELKKRMSLVEEEIEKISAEISITEKQNSSEVEYERLFETEYSFDKELINTTIPYVLFVEPLVKIQAFLRDYNAYKDILLNRRIDKALDFSRTVYMKAYYSKRANELKGIKERIALIERGYRFLRDVQDGKWDVDEDVFCAVGIVDEIRDSIREKLDEISKRKENMSAYGKAISEINDARNVLINKYIKAKEEGHVEEGKCPLCGATYEKIEDTFEMAEKTLLESMEITSNVIADIQKQVQILLENEVCNKIRQWLLLNKADYDDYLVLKECLYLDETELEHVLKSLQVVFATNDSNVVNVDTFELEYQRIVSEIKHLKKEVDKLLPDEVIENYNNISEIYYQCKKPVHTEEMIAKKIRYIAKLYASQLNSRLQEVLQKKDGIQDEITVYSKKSAAVLANLSNIRKKYIDAQKEYQTKLANSLRLPVLIYSGKIIQNYPLGLGIDMRVGNNQLVFEAYGKEGVDVFNILSTGQLNGLAIAVMLAVRSVFSNSRGLDMLLIDDPLQTIDEISSISLADLLLNDSIGQIILSTHEDRKAKMLEYKFEQRGLLVSEKNMKNIYLQSK